MKTTISFVAFSLGVALCGGLREVGAQSSPAANRAPSARRTGIESLQFFSPSNARKLLPLRDNKTLRKLALSQMPRGGISNFFGACKGRFQKRGANRDYLAANLYALPKDDPKTPRREYSLFLDVFSYSKKTARLTRLQRLDLTKKLKCIYGNWAQGSDSTGAIDLLWIDAKRQRTPMLRLQMSGEVMSGIAGCYGLVIFPDGLRAQTVVQDFETFSQRESAQNLFFGARDNRGFLVLRQDYLTDNTIYGQEGATAKLTKRTYFDWNGRAFIVRKNKTRVAKPS